MTTALIGKLVRFEGVNIASVVGAVAATIQGDKPA